MQVWTKIPLKVLLRYVREDKDDESQGIIKSFLFMYSFLTANYQASPYYHGALRLQRT